MSLLPSHCYMLLGHVSFVQCCNLQLLKCGCSALCTRKVISVHIWRFSSQPPSLTFLHCSPGKWNLHLKPSVQNRHIMPWLLDEGKMWLIHVLADGMVRVTFFVIISFILSSLFGNQETLTCCAAGNSLCLTYPAFTGVACKPLCSIEWSKSTNTWCWTQKLDNGVIWIHPILG